MDNKPSGTMPHYHSILHVKREKCDVSQMTKLHKYVACSPEALFDESDNEFLLNNGIIQRMEEVDEIRKDDCTFLIHDCNQTKH
eukprot:1650924-Ditylum_brightwellii.AAC.1